MWSNRRDADYLQDMLEAMERILAYTVGMSQEQFLNDTRTQDAVVRNIEVIGEAVKRLSEEVRHAYPDIPWRAMAGMRDKVIHHYFGVNYDVVWKVATEDVPSLLPRLKEILEREKGSGG